MTPLFDGSDLVAATKTLGFSRRELAEALGISLATLRRHETSVELEHMPALAVECLLRRRLSSNLSPEEKAERRFREAQHLAKLKSEAGLRKSPEARAEERLRTNLAYERLRAEAGIPTSQVRARVDSAEERKRLIGARRRNKRRDVERPMIQALHEQLRTIPRGTNEFQRAVSTVWRPCVDLGQHFLEHYCSEVLDRPIADDDPLVTLPPEVE